MKTLRIALLLFACLFSCATLCAKDEPPVYYVEAAGTGAQGTYLLKVTVITKKGTVKDDEICKAAVHAVLFRGFQDGTNGSQKPLAGSASAEEEHKDFFSKFFDNATYRSYVTMISGTRSIVKTADKKVRSTANVTVMKDNLRKALEQQGIVKPLGSGF